MKGYEVLIAIEQAEAVYRGGVTIAIVVGHLELLKRFFRFPKTHELDA